MNTFLSMTLCLITLFSFVSCASTERSVAQESEVKRKPEGDYRSYESKRVAKQKY